MITQDFAGQIAELGSGRILITGAHGMIGRAFARQLARHAPGCEMRALSRSDWDVRDNVPIDEHARWLGQGWIIHCAGVVEMDRIESEPVAAREIIVGGTGHVVRLARACGARILYPQSVFVYDGSENPAIETTPLNPLSLYGALKLAAEAMVRGHSDANLVIRMSGFFGGEEKDTNFIGWVIPHLHALIRAGEKSFEVGDRIWQPSYTMDLARNALLLAAKGACGVYVMGSHGEASFWEVTVEIARLLGWKDRIEIVKIPFQGFSQEETGRRPARLVVENKRLMAEGLDLQGPWREALAEYLAGAYFDQFRFNEQKS